MKFRKLVATTVCAIGMPVLAMAWDIAPAESVVSFGSIKNDYIGEAHVFTGLSGSVENDGSVSVSIDLTTLNTNIDIRNERMAEHVFRAASTADITANIDMDEVKSLRPGQSTVMEVDAVMTFLGNEVDVYFDAFVMRVGPRKVMVSTNTAAFLTTEDLGIDAGIDVLQGLANLDSITRVTPITLRLMFER